MTDSGSTSPALAGSDDSSVGRVASLTQAECDAPFRACIAAGSRILSGLSILACMPTPFDPARFRHLWMTVRCLSGLGCRRVKIIVLTETEDPDNIEQLRQLVRPVSDDIEIRPQHGIEDMRALPWRHKAIIRDEFLTDPAAFDLFLYLEDDILLTAENLAYFIAFRQGLDRFRFIPSFVRCEYNFTKHRLHAIDHVFPQPVSPRQKLRIGQTLFVNTNFPFCATYIFDHALARAHMGTRSASMEESASVVWWGVVEHASLGQMFEDVPGGVLSRYMVPVDPISLRLLPACIVHHATDKYTNLDAEHGRVPLDDVFHAEP